MHMVESLRNAGKPRTAATSRRLWQPVLPSLLKIAQKRRKEEAVQSRKDVTNISPRNIIAKMSYSDKSVRDEIMKTIKFSALRKSQSPCMTP